MAVVLEMLAKAARFITLAAAADGVRLAAGRQMQAAAQEARLSQAHLRR
tara:strand:- start:1647 stop:1793 length:147 start_codon:yes stop_codon:yes gene_type:complete